MVFCRKREIIEINILEVNIQHSVVYVEPETVAYFGAFKELR
jgi:hypothetical protein